MFRNIRVGHSSRRKNFLVMTLAGVSETTVAAFLVLIRSRRRRCWACRAALPCLPDRYLWRAFHNDQRRAASVHWGLQ